MVSSDSPIIITVVNAIVNKINSLISTHNSNNSAHSDIRNSIPTKTSDIVNDSGFITSHQSLNNYYTKSEIDELIGDIEEDMQS